MLSVWCHSESNQGHKDFQSFALPTELWHLFLSGCKDMNKILFTQVFQEKYLNICILFIFLKYLCRAFLTNLGDDASIHTDRTGCSAVGSALRSGRRGRAFESPHPDKTRDKGLIINSFLFVGAKMVGEKSVFFYLNLSYNQ